MSRSYATYLPERGFDERIVGDLGWRVGQLNGNGRKDGLPSHVQVWFIPYTAGGRALFERVRVLDPADIRRHGSKYRQPKEHRLRPYDSDGRLERAPGERLIIVEGEAGAGSRSAPTCGDPEDPRSRRRLGPGCVKP